MRAGSGVPVAQDVGDGVVDGQAAAGDEVGDQAGPSGLVGGAEAGAVVAVEVFVEGQQVVPGGVGLETLRVTEDRPAAVGVVEEDRDESAAQVVGDALQVDCRLPLPVGISTVRSSPKYWSSRCRASTVR